MKSLEITLLYPFTDGNGKPIDKINMRRSTVGDLRKVSKIKDAAEMEITLFASLLGMLPEDLDRMDQADYGAVQEMYTERIAERKKNPK